MRSGLVPFRHILVSAHVEGELLAVAVHADCLYVFRRLPLREMKHFGVFGGFQQKHLRNPNKKEFFAPKNRQLFIYRLTDIVSLRISIAL